MYLGRDLLARMQKTPLLLKFEICHTRIPGPTRRLRAVQPWPDPLPWALPDYTSVEFPECGRYSTLYRLCSLGGQQKYHIPYI